MIVSLVRIADAAPESAEDSYKRAIAILQALESQGEKLPDADQLMAIRRAGCGRLAKKTVKRLERWLVDPSCVGNHQRPASPRIFNQH